MMLILRSTRNCFRRLLRHRRSRNSNDDDDATVESLDTVREKYRLLYEHADSLGGSAGKAFRDKIDRTMEEIEGYHRDEALRLQRASAAEVKRSTELTSHHPSNPSTINTERRKEGTSTHSVDALVPVKRSPYRMFFPDGNQITVLPSDPSQGYFSDRFFIPRSIDLCSIPTVRLFSDELDPDFVIWSALVVWSQEHLVDPVTRDCLVMKVFALEKAITNNDTISTYRLAEELDEEVMSLIRSSRGLQQVPPYDTMCFSWQD
ncbi:hypothetical protein IV203_014879 [Nitzschia inconspicua]|uniref:Uncharacterized protein n=1 Tax=Nitzschia inconspicua TaxID=303405 RepID=A0A9K3K5D0_9STRA|nr:hypothetical protein IV203_020435 [Nitzschia inconspicua]KAG7358291.1 hypothetical protein IV203_014879 [Nitzschia inconspicua]